MGSFPVEWPVSGESFLLSDAFRKPMSANMVADQWIHVLRTHELCIFSSLFSFFDLYSLLLFLNTLMF